MTIDGIRDGLADLEGRMDHRFDAVDRRFEMIDGRLDGIDGKLSRYFTWLVGLYVTSVIAAITALVAR
jgi:hypothetical protein